MTGANAVDLTFLLEASKRLHGYLLHTWFMHYLAVIADNVQRWMTHGVIGTDGRPNDESNVAFDIDSINLEKLTYVIGFYLYILSSHKKANYFLMKENDTKRVLYLRGFDFEGATRIEGKLAIGYSSDHTRQFSHRLADQLRPELEIFTALSPKDLYWETADAQRYFFGDYGRLIQLCSNPIRSIYLNANHWQADVTELVDRMDFFVVYVSSITESVLWELELLKTKQRMDHTTVVFDEDAIANKELQTGVQERMKEEYGDRVIWSKAETGAPACTPKELRDSLTQSFVVVSPDDFFAEIDQHKARIQTANSPLGVGSREAPIPFRFYPALDADALKEIQDFDESIETFIRQQVSSRAITNLPWLLNHVQLKIFTSLMLGRHDETGHALAVYAAIMDVLPKQLFGTSKDEVADDRERRARKKLHEHFEMAASASPTLMAYGKSDEFGDYLAKAVQTYDEVFASTSDAIDSFFQRRRGLYTVSL